MSAVDRKCRRRRSRWRTTDLKMALLEMSGLLLNYALVPESTDAISGRGSHLQENPPAVEHPHRNEADRGEAGRIGKGGPPRVRNAREYVVDRKGDHVGLLAVVHEVDVVQHTWQQFAEHVCCNRVGAEDAAYPLQGRRPIF